MSAAYDTGRFSGLLFLLKHTQHYGMNGMKSKHKSVHGVSEKQDSSFGNRDHAWTHKCPHVQNMWTQKRTQKPTHTHKQSQERNRCGENIGHPIYNVTFTAAGLCSTLSPWLWHTVCYSVISQLTALLNHYTSDSRRGHQAEKSAHIHQTFFLGAVQPLSVNTTNARRCIKTSLSSTGSTLWK